MEPKTENLGEEILCRLILEENLCGDILENLRGDMKTLKATHTKEGVLHIQ